VLFTARAHAAIAQGTITRTFRTWKRPQVKVGGRYRAGPVDLLVDRLARVSLADVTDDDARHAGFEDREAMIEFLHKRSNLAPGDELWRVDFHAVEPSAVPSIAADPNLTDADMAELDRRLDRLDAASATGRWTREVLALIAENPGVVSTDLAKRLGRDRAAFKADVRKLKRLGLTVSLEVGYQLSPRGEAFLAR
jgi:hypothetical protein